MPGAPMLWLISVPTFKLSRLLGKHTHTPSPERTLSKTKMMMKREDDKDDVATRQEGYP